MKSEEFATAQKMKEFNIQSIDKALQASIQEKIDNLNKPKGSLGRLEELALQICLIQQTLEPSLAHPCHLLLGGDHGIEREGVSVSPREVTWQQMINFTRGGGGVNMFCRQHGFKLRIVDVGVDYNFENVQCSMFNVQCSILDRKIAYGTKNFLYEPAMTEEEFDRAIQIGSDLVDDCIAEGCRVLSIGEMGIANTSPSSIWMHLFCNIPLADCIGAGAGLNNEGIRHKYKVLSLAVENFRVKSEELRVKNNSNHSESETNVNSSLFTLHSSLDEVIRSFGGFEMVAAIGAMLRAAEQHLIILVDGFIMTACALAATRLYPAAQDYMIFTHCGDESGHKRMLDAMQAKPLLHLGLRLGEGTGALCAFPIIDSAVRMMNEMNNFKNAQITKYF
jgi:nicotinate-nucleotide--dimethylbenzimidazole phosphoribosyltransferase